VGESFGYRLEELDRLLQGAAPEMLGKLEDYALCFDYVAPDTFQDQEEGYFRYQLSWGGPSDEFRFYVDGKSRRIEYWFMDWFDGASLLCSDNEIVTRLWAWLRDTGAVARARREQLH
jgi:hypothetical protein